MDRAKLSCLNEDKTKVLRFGKADLLAGFNSAVGSLDSNWDFIRNLEVILDYNFKFDGQVCAVVRSSFYLFPFKVYLES